MQESKVTLSTADGPMDAFLALPDGAARAPALVVIQEAFGVNPHIQDVCRRLAGEGYLALAPEVFHRTGAGLTFAYDDLARARPVFATLDNRTLETDVQAALAALRARPDVDARRVGIIGFCMGGFTAFLAACRTEVATAVCFYPGGLVRERPGLALQPLLGEVAGMRAPVLLFFGEADPSIPHEDVEAVRAALRAADRVHEIVVYPGAGHGFFCDRRPAAFHAEAAADAWSITLDWLRDRLAAL